LIAHTAVLLLRVAKSAGRPNTPNSVGVMHVSFSEAMAKRRISKIFAVVFGLYISLSLAAGAFVAEGALHPVRRQLTPDDVKDEMARARDENAALTDAAITTTDGIRLRAWDLRPENANGDAVILLHGLSDNRLGMTRYADLFLRHGYRVLMPDGRAHGASDGLLATYGLLETSDLGRWLDWLVANHQPHCIYGFGESMGAAELLQAIGTEARFCAVAGECPFSNFREIAYDRMGQHLNAGPWVGRTILWPVVESAFIYSRWKYGLDFEQVSPEETVAKTKVPVFLIHGQSDTNIPIRHSRRILARNPSVVLWVVPSAEHSSAVNVYPDEFNRRLVGWFENHSRGSD
jgi:pimeloyl-ACP methyl ester carboxylesterase